MFYGKLEDSRGILPHQVWAQVKMFLGQDLDALRPGRHILIPQQLTAQVAVDPLTTDHQRGESHQKFLDIHVVHGTEIIKFAFPENCILQTPYAPDNDVTWWKMNLAQEFILRPNYIALFFPGEIHAASIGRADLKRKSKIVFKLLWPGLSSEATAMA